MKAVFWDMGGVLLRTEDQSPRRSWEQKLGLEPGQLHDLVFGSEISRAASIGKASEEDIWLRVQQQLTLSDSDLQALRHDFFKNDVMDPVLMDYIRTLGDRYRVGMITNAWPNIRHMLTDIWHTADAFETIIVSAEEGIVKPDPEIYLLALRKLGVSASESIFIDDFIQNIRGAEAVGMHALQFINRDQVLHDLELILQKSRDE